MAVGRFVEDRWLAEERMRKPGEALDEDASWNLWDECSEKHLRGLRTEAAELLQCEIRSRRARSLAAEFWQKVEPLNAAAKVLAWIVIEAARGFVAAIGLVAFGLLIVWAAPKVAKSVRAAVDDNLPADTRPDREKPSPVAP
jgi:hypothetical protein